MAGSATRSETNQSFFVFIKDRNTSIVQRVAIPGDVQVGLVGRPSELQLLGRLSLASTTMKVDSLNKGIINVSNHDTVMAVSLSVTPLSGRIRVYLPPTPRVGQLHFIKDSSGSAGTVPIDIIPPNGVMIDGQASQSLSDAYDSLALVWLDGQWRKLIAGLGTSSGGGGAPTSASYVTINAESGLSNERHLTGSTNLVMTDNGANASVYFDLTPVLGVGAGTFAAPTLTVDSWGRITAISAGSVGASAASSFITVTNEPGLSAERALVAGTGLKSTDGGANSNFTLQVNDNIVATVSGTRFTGPVVAVGGLTGSLQQLNGGGSYLVAGSNVTITSQSNGQVIVSATTGGGSSSATTCAITSSVSLFSMVDSISTGSSTPTLAVGNFTTGCRFMLQSPFNQPPLQIIGIRFYTSLASPGGVVRCKLWNASNVTIAVTDVNVSGPGIYVASFGTSSYTASDTSQYGKSMHVSTYITNSLNYTVSSGAPLFLPTFPCVWGRNVILVSQQAWNNGDTAPTNTAASERYPVEPIIITVMTGTVL